MMQNQDSIQPLVQWDLQEVLEPEMTDSLGAARGVPRSSFRFISAVEEGVSGEETEGVDHPDFTVSRE